MVLTRSSSRARLSLRLTSVRNVFILLGCVACAIACGTTPASRPPVGAPCSSSADCNGVAPNCLNGLCSACDATCTGTTPVCVASAGCVQCVSDGDCHVGATFCLARECVECRDNTDCPSTAPSCEPRDHVCRPACTTSADCSNSAASLCEPTASVCVGCFSNTECDAEHPICDAQTSQCVPCTLDIQCASDTPFCVANRCVECLQTEDCGATNEICTAALECARL